MTSGHFRYWGFVGTGMSGTTMAWGSVTLTFGLSGVRSCERCCNCDRCPLCRKRDNNTLLDRIKTSFKWGNLLHDNDAPAESVAAGEKLHLKLEFREPRLYTSIPIPDSFCWKSREPTCFRHRLPFLSLIHKGTTFTCCLVSVFLSNI